MRCSCFQREALMFRRLLQRLHNALLLEQKSSMADARVKARISLYRTAQSLSDRDVADRLYPGDSLRRRDR